MKHLKYFFVMTMVLAFVLAACGGGGGGNKFANVTYQMVLQWKQHYADVYPLETKTSTAFDLWWGFVDNGLGQIKDMNFLAQNCYSNVTQVVENGTIGIYDSGKNADGSGNGVLNPSSMISALVTNGLYPANADKCSAMMQETLASVEKVRTEGYQKQVDFKESRRVLQNAYDGTVDAAILRRLLNLYGTEFVSYMNELLQSHGVEPFPADFVGWPTSGVEVHTTSRSWCDYYAGIAAGTTKPGTAGMAPAMYVANWIGPEKGGQCDLQRQAAYEFMSRTFYSTSTGNAIGCGENTGGLSSSTDANCNTTENNPAAATPLPKATAKPASP